MTMSSPRRNQPAQHSAVQYLPAIPCLRTPVERPARGLRGFAVIAEQMRWIGAFQISSITQQLR